MSLSTVVGVDTAVTSAEARVLDAVDETGMVERLQEFLAVPSVGGSDAESDAQVTYARWLEESGCDVDVWSVDLPATLAHPDFPGSEVERTEALGVVGSWGRGGGRTLVLNGHVDVVPTGDPGQWYTDPFQGVVLGNRVYGRGACDMKAGLIVNLFALRAVRAAGVQLPGRVLLQSVVGEEDGGLGTFATLQRGYRGDAAIIPEPTRLDLVPACAGALTFRLRLTGLSAHACRRLEGVDTLEKFFPVWQALRRLEARRNETAHHLMDHLELPYPINLGVLRAGEWASSVPDQLVAEGRIGVALDEAPEEARRQLEEAVAEVCAGDPWLRLHPVTVEWFGGQFASGVAGESDLLPLLGSVHRDVAGRTPAVHGEPYGSDLRLFDRLGGVPAVHYGPGDVRFAHAPNEHVRVSELAVAARVIALAITRFCSA